jgi:hypothetical protein
MKHLKLIILILTLSLLWVMPSYARDGGHRNGNKQFSNMRNNWDNRLDHWRNNGNNMQERWQDGWGDMRNRQQNRREHRQDNWDTMWNGGSGNHDRRNR